jgi:hypothetical protein
LPLGLKEVVFATKRHDSHICIRPGHVGEDISLKPGAIDEVRCAYLRVPREEPQRCALSLDVRDLMFETDLHPRAARSAIIDLATAA